MKKVVLLVVISIFFITGCSVKRTEDVTDGEIFASEYAVNKDNVFKYATIEEVLSLFKDGTGVILFGNSDQDECYSVVKMFMDLVSENNISEVYYYDPTMIRDDGSKEYDELLNLLGDNLTITDDDLELMIPSVYFVRDGEIVGYNDEAVLMLDIADEVELDDFLKVLENKYFKLIKKYVDGESEDVD